MTTSGKNHNIFTTLFYQTEAVITKTLTTGHSDLATTSIPITTTESNLAITWQHSISESTNISTKVTEQPLVLFRTGPPEWCLTFDLFNYGIIIGLVCLFGIPGNTLSILTLWPKVRSNTTSFLLVTLAILDNEILFFHFLAKGVPVICNYFHTCVYYLAFIDPVLQTVGWYLTHIIQMVSVWNVVLISFCRYIAVCRPHDTMKYTPMKRIRVMFAIMVILNTIMYAPRLGRNTIEWNKDHTKWLRVYQPYIKNTAFILYNVLIYYIFVYLVPFAMLVTMTYLQIKALKKSKQRRETMSKSKRAEHDVTVTLIVVVIVFMLCQLWEPIRRLSEMLPEAYTDCSTLKYHAYGLKTFFTTLNSAVNIIIYCACGKQFRRDLIHRVFKRNSIYPMGTTTAPDGMSRGKHNDTSVSHLHQENASHLHQENARHLHQENVSHLHQENGGNKAI